MWKLKTIILNKRLFWFWHQLSELLKCLAIFQSTVNSNSTCLIFSNCSSFHSALTLGCIHFLKKELSLSSNVSSASVGKKYTILNDMKDFWYNSCLLSPDRPRKKWALCILRSGVGAEFWSGVLESNYSCTFHHKIQQNMCQKSKLWLNEWLIRLAYQIYNGNCLSVLFNLFGVECWSGVESNFGVANVFCSIHRNIAGHMKTSKECDQVKAPVWFCCWFRQDQFVTPKFDSIPRLHSTEYTVPKKWPAQNFIGLHVRLRFFLFHVLRFNFFPSNIKFILKSVLLSNLKKNVYAYLPYSIS